MILSIWLIVLVHTCMRIWFALSLFDIKQYMSYKSEIQAALLRYGELVHFAGKMTNYFFIHMARAAQGSSFLPGIKQRLLSFIFHKTWNEEPDQALRVQHLKKKFYFHFQDYVDLIIWKVQFLDR
uniref:Uncharacterized protein n=1 Tax=Aegilops tauschii subsp. strangulata TaxID=200361 RepID=A0A453I7V3_AEGTS